MVIEVSSDVPGWVDGTCNLSMLTSTSFFVFVLPDGVLEESLMLNQVRALARLYDETSGS